MTASKVVFMLENLVLEQHVVSLVCTLRALLSLVHNIHMSTVSRIRRINHIKQLQCKLHGACMRGSVNKTDK